MTSHGTVNGLMADIRTATRSSIGQQRAQITLQSASQRQVCRRLRSVQPPAIRAEHSHGQADLAAPIVEDSEAACRPNVLQRQRCPPAECSSAPPESLPSRRSALHALLCAGAAWAGAPSASDALVEVELPDGRHVTAWEFDVPLRVVALRGSVPQSWLEGFKAVAGKKARFKYEQRNQLADIYSELTNRQSSRKSAATADAVTLGDAWLAPAIQAGALQPIETPERWRYWELLPRRWKQLVRRNRAGLLDPRGDVWAIPYRWGCTLVAYRKEKLPRPIGDWQDLLQPALQRRIGVTENPREVLAITFKTLGLPLITTPQDLAAAGITERDVAERLRLLRRQVLVVSNREATRALSAGDIWALVGWSEDLVPLALSSSRISLVAPESGTMLWADLWTIPSGATPPSGPSPLLPLWFEFAVQPARAAELIGLRKGLSPLLLPDESGMRQQAQGPAPGTQVLGGYIPQDPVLAASDFLLPLDSETKAMYHRLLWSV